MGLFEKISGGGTFTGAQEIKCAYLYLLTNRRLNEEEATKIGKKALKNLYESDSVFKRNFEEIENKKMTHMGYQYSNTISFDQIYLKFIAWLENEQGINRDPNRKNRENATFFTEGEIRFRFDDDPIKFFAAYYFHR